MHIAFVSNVVYPFTTGGAQKRIHEIGTRLAAAGHDVTIYGRHYWEGPRETMFEGVRLRAVAPSHDLYNENGGRRSITEAIDFALRLVPVLRRHLTEHDVVVASVFPFFPVLTARLDLVRTEIPLVTTWHEVWRSYWNDYLGQLAVFGKAVERITAKIPQYPVAVSGVTADRLATIGPSREAIEVIPNGIDFEHIRSVPPAQDGFDVLFAGRLIEEKNVTLLLDAFDRVATEYNVTLGIIGEGPMLDTLRTKARTLATHDQITFLGFLDDHDDVLAQMAAADVFVSPSTREGFGITYAEAMAADCTVIGVDHPQSAADEVIQGGGFLVEPTVDDIAIKLDTVLSGEEPPTDPLAVARQFDWQTVADQAATAYQSAIETDWSPSQ